MLFNQKLQKKAGNLQLENAKLRSALEVILLEIENDRPESARIYAQMVLRKERLGGVTQEVSETKHLRLQSEWRANRSGHHGAVIKSLLQANS